jgi:hypothetical protein
MRDVATLNDQNPVVAGDTPKRRGPCRSAVKRCWVEARAVTAEPVRSTAWLDIVTFKKFSCTIIDNTARFR